MLITGIIIGVIVGSTACVISSKYFGWFNKKVGQIETKVKG